MLIKQMEFLSTRATPKPRRRPGARSAALAFLMIGLAAATASAQEPRELGTTDHGRVSRGGTLLAARDAARNAGFDCEVVAAVRRGRSEDGDYQYEVVCRDKPGYLIIDNRTGYNCLALEGQNQRIQRGERSGPLVPTCRHPRNRNPTRHFVAMAAEAGVNCRIDEGFAVGLSTAGFPIYELGCRNGLGAWIEQTPAGWIVTDCLQVRSQGGVCRFTTPVEEFADFPAASRSQRPTGLQADSFARDGAQCRRGNLLRGQLCGGRVHCGGPGCPRRGQEHHPLRGSLPYWRWMCGHEVRPQSVGGALTAMGSGPALCFPYPSPASVAA